VQIAGLLEANTTGLLDAPGLALSVNVPFGA
jgi:hypothetical protein